MLQETYDMLHAAPGMCDEVRVLGTGTNILQDVYKNVRPKGAYGCHASEACRVAIIFGSSYDVVRWLIC